MVEYYFEKEIIYAMITFLLGKDSPCYYDSLGKNNENWGLIRQTPTQIEPCVDLIYFLYKKTKLKVLNQEEKNDSTDNLKIEHTDSETQTDVFTLSKKDRKCLYDPRFLKFLFKYSKKFPLFNTELSIDDETFSLNSCLEITKYVEDIAYSDETELIRLFKNIAPVLEINDHQQFQRIEIIIGMPQVIVSDSNNSKYNWPVFGYNKLTDPISNFVEYRSLYNYRNNCCFLKKIFSKAKEKVQIELFLEMMIACFTNPLLYKYLKNVPAEDIQCNK